MKSISHSQFSAYNECNLKWKLRYIDKLSKFSGSIHTVFGTAMHTTIQAYLTEFYNKSIKSADSMDLPTMLKEEMIKEFKEKVRFTRGKKYTKILNGNSVWGFIANGDGILKGIPYKKGDVFMAATWRAPAKHVRGNIFTNEQNYFRWTGPDYIVR